MAKKDKTAKLPKKVGGVKLPKQLRKSAGVVADIAQSPIAREVVSAALVAGAAALAKRKSRDGAASAPAAKSNDLDTLIAQGKEVGNMIAQGVNAFFGALLKPADKAATTAAKPAAPTPRAANPRTAKAPAVKPASAKRAPAKPAVSAATRKPRAKPGPKPKA